MLSLLDLSGGLRVVPVAAGIVARWSHRARLHSVDKVSMDNHDTSTCPALYNIYVVSHQQRETQKNGIMSMDCLVLAYT